MHAYQNLHKKQRGFSLIEILVVLVIMGILISLVAPNVLNRIGQAQSQKVFSDFKAIETALTMYKLDNFKYPDSQQGLNALVGGDNSGSGSHWRKGGYLKDTPKDPWNQPYKYLSPGQNGEYDLYTLGADNAVGGEGQDADIGNWQEK